MPPYFNNRNNLTPNNEAAESVNLNSPNLRIMSGNTYQETVPLWLKPGHLPSNLSKLRSRAANLEIDENMAPPPAKKFRLGKAPGQNGGRRTRRTKRSLKRTKRSKTK